MQKHESEGAYNESYLYLPFRVISCDESCLYVSFVFLMALSVKILLKLTKNCYINMRI
jgi:hypothetical protein